MNKKEASKGIPAVSQRLDQNCLGENKSRVKGERLII